MEAFRPIKDKVRYLKLSYLLYLLTLKPSRVEL